MTKTEEHELRRAAAALGPGYKGVRAEADSELRTQEAERIRSADLPNPPAYLSQIHQVQDWRDRKAKLFEIGEYEDKNLSITEADLQRLAENFDLPVPILIEHVESPLRMGYLTEVKAVGGELFGTLALTPEADELIEASGAKSLSISVARDLSRIFEVSIVSNPRIESARLFCSDFSALGKKELTNVNRLKDELELVEIEKAVEGMIRSGKFGPSFAEKVKAAIFKAKKIGFENEMRMMVELLSSKTPMGEIVPANIAQPVGITAEEAQFYRDHFPGLDLEEIAKHKEAL